MKLALGLGFAIGSGDGIGGATTSLTVAFDDNTSGTLPHRVYYEITGAAGDPDSVDVAVGDNSVVLTGLAFNSSYDITVKSVDGAVESDALSVTVYTSPQHAPSGLTATALSQSQILLDWSEPSSTPVNGGYSIEVSANGGSTWSVLTTKTVGATTHIHGGLAGNSTRHYRIRSYNDNADPHDDGYSPYSAVVSETTDAPAGFSFVSNPVIVTYETLQFDTQPEIVPF